MSLLVRRNTTAIVVRPRTWLGAGVCPYFHPFSAPEMRGMARRRGACPGLLQGGPICVRASPDRRTLTLMTRAPAPLGAPPRHRLAFAFHGSRTRRRLSTYGGLPESRPGTWLRATPAGAASRPTLMTPHESAPQWTRLHAHIVKITPSVNRPRCFFRAYCSGRRHSGTRHRSRVYPRSASKLPKSAKADLGGAGPE